MNVCSIEIPLCMCACALFKSTSDVGDRYVFKKSGREAAHRARVETEADRALEGAHRVVHSIFTLISSKLISII